MKKLVEILLIFCFVFFTSQSFGGNGIIGSKVIDKAKKSIVTIETRISVSAYSSLGSWSGTGFIVDKKNGFIVTNCHIVGRASIGTYFVTFYNGKQAEARLIYYDAWQDQAILKVDPKDIPDCSSEIQFSDEDPKVNQSIFIVGNNEGKEFSIHYGTISSLYEVNGDMPQHSYIINVNTFGGSSGSPIINSNGDAVALNYGGGETFALALNGKYVKRIVNDLRSNRKIVRKHIGVIANLYSLDKAVKHRKFPEDVMDSYLKQFPDTRNKVLSVEYIMQGSPAEKYLKAGDIIWAVNDVIVGGDLYKLDNMMDNAVNDLSFTIYRDGEKINFTVELYDVEANKVTKILNFGGATFFEADDFTSAKSGVELGRLYLVNVQTGSSFSSIRLNSSHNDRSFYRIAMISINGHNTKKLDDLIKIVPSLIDQKFIVVDLQNYLPYYQAFGNILMSDHLSLSADIILDSIDTEPRVLEYLPEKMEWISSEPIYQK